MLDFFRGPARSPAPLSRRAFLRIGTLGLGGLTLADLIRLEAQGATCSDEPRKAVIMVYLAGGPSHIDMYDMKPDTPSEIRGEFKPIRTNVPGMDICELMPLQARIADKLAIVRGFQTLGNHDAVELTTGFGPKAHRPAFGSVVSRLEPREGRALPPYVSLIQESNLPFGQEPAYLGPAHQPFSLRGPGMADLKLSRDVTLDRLTDRAQLLRGFDRLRRDLEVRHELAGMDAFVGKALDMVTSTRTLEAFDLAREPLAVREKYGKLPGTVSFLLARRLVEAGVRVVTLCGGWANGGGPGSSSSIGNWDTHEDNFPRLRQQLPHLDHALYTLIDDLNERGLGKDVAVVVCGEMGRSPRVGKANAGSNVAATGRDHWATGFALLAGGGLRMGQVIGETDRLAGRAKGRPYTPQNLLATLYHLLGIDAGMTFPDHLGRPQYLLDDRARIAELG